MTTAEQHILLQIAREAIQAKLENRHPEYPEPTPELLHPSAVFVTLHTNGRLRGCIGTLEASKQLFEAVEDYALSSAFKDPRFPPLAPSEIGNLSIEISVLSPLKKVESMEEIKIGTHGLYVKQGLRSGVLLPQVPVEQGWNRKEFIKNTCRKAGLRPDAWMDDDTVFFSFTAEIFGEEN